MIIDVTHSNKSAAELFPVRTEDESTSAMQQTESNRKATVNSRNDDVMQKHRHAHASSFRRPQVLHDATNGDNYGDASVRVQRLSAACAKIAQQVRPRAFVFYRACILSCLNLLGTIALIAPCRCRSLPSEAGLWAIDFDPTNHPTLSTKRSVCRSSTVRFSAGVLFTDTACTMRKNGFKSI
jgi:hypothetical protein